jgi:hypothetical protein
MTDDDTGGALPESAFVSAEDVKHMAALRERAELFERIRRDGCRTCGATIPDPDPRLDRSPDGRPRRFTQYGTGGPCVVDCCDGCYDAEWLLKGYVLRGIEHHRRLRGRSLPTDAEYRLLATIVQNPDILFDAIESAVAKMAHRMVVPK